MNKIVLILLSCLTITTPAFGQVEPDCPPETELKNTILSIDGVTKIEDFLGGPHKEWCQ